MKRVSGTIVPIDSPNNGQIHFEGSNLTEREYKYDKTIDPDNPDPEKYARNEEGELILKPRQCFGCLSIFTPEKETDRYCKECIDQPPEEDRLAECKHKNCKETAIAGTKDGLCKKHREEKRKSRRDWYQRQKDGTATKRDYKKRESPMPEPLKSTKKRIESTNGLEELRGTPKSKLIKGLFFLFKDEITRVQFHLRDGESFGITFEEPEIHTKR